MKQMQDMGWTKPETKGEPIPSGKKEKREKQYPNMTIDGASWPSGIEKKQVGDELVMTARVKIIQKSVTEKEKPDSWQAPASVQLKIMEASFGDSEKKPEDHEATMKKGMGKISERMTEIADQEEGE